MALIMTGGCDGSKGQAVEPPVPTQLVAHDELPFGDRESARITRASNAVRDVLEPKWGHLDSRIYTVTDADRDAVLRQFAENMPQGWEPVQVAQLPSDGMNVVRSFAKGGRINALLLVDLGNSSGKMAAILFRGQGK